jgi:hypothetical protein
MKNIFVISLLLTSALTTSMGLYNSTNYPRPPALPALNDISKDYVL